MADFPGQDEVASPCIKVCVVNADNICTGCGRSVAEIALWPGADPVLRRTILRAAALRRDGLHRLSKPAPDKGA